MASSSRFFALPLERRELRLDAADELGLRESLRSITVGLGMAARQPELEQTSPPRARFPILARSRDFFEFVYFLPSRPPQGAREGEGVFRLCLVFRMSTTGHNQVPIPRSNGGVRVARSAPALVLSDG